MNLKPDFWYRLVRRNAHGVADDKFVFIVACGRSGSTLLQKILGSNERCHIVGENNNVLGALLCAYNRALKAKQTESNVAREDLGDPWRGIHRIDPERFGRKLARVFVDELIQPPSGARIVGFKEIRYIDDLDSFEQYLDHMRHLFSSSIIIFNKRNSLDTAKSLSSWWKSLSFEQIVSEVELFNKRGEAYAGAHSSSCIVVDYDKYTSDPDELRPLFARLQLPFYPSKLQQILSVRLTH